ncbi:MAG: MMPL family transporter, partial [Solirubrobacterales bacterium]|nr:MMPL family transporter [Solirubrobacterales bacterium]
MGPLSRILAAVMGAAARRPLAVGLVATVLALAGAALALRLEPSAATDTLVGKSSATYEATQREHERFGEDAVIVLVKGDLSRLLLTSDLERLLGLEGCLSGNAPKDVVPRGGKDGPCARLARDKPVKVVFGPATFINESIRQITEQFQTQVQDTQAKSQRARDAAYKLARSKGYSVAQAKTLAKQAEDLVGQQFLRDTLRLVLRYGITKQPQLNDTQFVSQLVFAPGKAPGTPKARFAYLFPTADSALVQVRLKPGLSEDERREALGLVRAATRMPDWQLKQGGQYVVTGAPVVLNDLTTSITDSIVVLLIASLLVMALALGLVFRARMRMLPLLVALAATGITFGALSLSGASLTMASI